jgi:hypothetical protein
MLSRTLASFLLLPVAIRAAAFTNSTSSSTACNNSPNLCSKGYDQITFLGAHDSPFLRDASTDYSASGNQYYDTTTSLSAGVRLLTAQVQLGGNSGNELHVCHTSCDLLDAGTLSSWLAEVRSWMNSNPNDVVTVLLVNGAGASASELAAQYQSAGITTSLAYTPSGSTSQSQQWPTLQSLINSGTRLVNFVASLDDNSAAPFLMNEFNYVFENNYEVSSPSNFTCEASRPSTETSQLVSNDMLPLMNHFLYHIDGGSLFNIESPNSSYVGTTNAPQGGVGNLGTAATTCRQYYGRAPSFILVDFATVGPAIATVDHLNGVTNPVGRAKISTANQAPTSMSSPRTTSNWILMGLTLPLLSAFALL